MKLFTDQKSNAKMAKSGGLGYEAKILHLAPAMESGYEVCSSRSAGCTAACLFTAGRGKMTSVKKARVARTKFFFEDRNGFKKQIQKELDAFKRKCTKNKTKPAARLNGTSDIIWERVAEEFFTDNPEIQFYCYSKHAKRFRPDWALPDNYHLTFSKSESNDAAVAEVLSHNKFNVCAVFASEEFPDEWMGRKVYNADVHDLRFLDPPGGFIGGLKAKGDAKKDTSGFVIQLQAYKGPA